MSVDAPEQAEPCLVDAGPLGPLPRLRRRQVQLDHLLARGASALPLREALRWLDDAARTPIEIGHPEVFWRAAGLARPGVNALLAWPRLGARLAVGLDTPAAHAVVDRLLGYERLAGEERLQVTPVEWGILAFVAARTLDRLDAAPGPLGPWDLILDRVGPEPFSADGLGPIVTVRWPIRVGEVAGMLRLWLPEMLLERILDAAPAAPPPIGPADLRGRFAKLAGTWRAEAGTVAMPRGLGRLRVGGVLPIDGSRLRGTPATPEGPIELTLRDRDGRTWLPATALAGAGGGRLVVSAPMRRELAPREALAVSAPNEPGTNAPAVAPTDVPVTLTIELGRVSLPLARLADLKPGDVVELGRHSREPVELTSNGRLVARGELVQIDTELGVRVTSVFL